ncbi:MAG: DUF1330 domain-containing protein [Ilumatobacter sp.]|nr:DUF1330 domain-containing protein [Ilumatobacter sp.]
MPAYVIVDTKINDPDGYEEYKALAKPIAERYGGEYLVRGGEIDLIDDDLWTPTRIVLVRFPDRAAARAFHDSEEYAAVAALRHEYADSTLMIVDGD